MEQSDIDIQVINKRSKHLKWLFIFFFAFSAISIINITSGSISDTTVTGVISRGWLRAAIEDKPETELVYGQVERELEPHMLVSLFIFGCISAYLGYFVYKKRKNVKNKEGKVFKILKEIELADQSLEYIENNIKGNVLDSEIASDINNLEKLKKTFWQTNTILIFALLLSTLSTDATFKPGDIFVLLAVVGGGISIAYWKFFKKSNSYIEKAHESYASLEIPISELSDSE